MTVKYKIILCNTIFNMQCDEIAISPDYFSFEFCKKNHSVQGSHAHNRVVNQYNLCILSK